MKVQYAGATDVGKVRDHNEDSFAIVPEQDLILVCDGMGGHAAGEVASQLGVETITTIVKDRDFALFTADVFSYPESITPAGKLLVGAISVANQRIIDRAKASTTHLGMGTTVVACCFENGIVSVCHVGDSRAYLIRDGRATCLTNDHTTVGDLVRMRVLPPNKVRTHAQRSILTRGLGLALFVQPDLAQHKLKDDDRLILCSDGVWSVIQDDEFAQLAAEVKGMQALSRALIDLALERQTDDNASAIAIHIQCLTPSPAGSERRRSRSWPYLLRKLWSF